LVKAVKKQVALAIFIFIPLYCAKNGKF